MAKYTDIEHFTLSEMKDYFRSIGISVRLESLTLQELRVIISDGGKIIWDETYALVHELPLSWTFMLDKTNEDEICELFHNLWHEIVIRQEETERMEVRFPYVEELHKNLSDALYYLKDRKFEVTIQTSSSGFIIQIIGKKGNRVVYGRSHMHYLPDAIKLVWEEYKYQYTHPE